MNAQLCCRSPPRRGRFCFHIYILGSGLDTVRIYQFFVLCREKRKRTTASLFLSPFFCPTCLVVSIRYISIRTQILSSLSICGNGNPLLFLSGMMIAFCPESRNQKADNYLLVPPRFVACQDRINIISKHQERAGWMLKLVFVYELLREIPCGVFRVPVIDEARFRLISEKAPRVFPIFILFSPTSEFVVCRSPVKRRTDSTYNRKRLCVPVTAAVSICSSVHHKSSSRSIDDSSCCWFLLRVFLSGESLLQHSRAQIFSKVYSDVFIC